METPSTRCDVHLTGLACERLLFESKTQTGLPVVTQVLIPLFAAFFGALAAFLLENMQRKRAEKRKFRAAGNETLLALGFYWHEINQFRRGFIDPYRSVKGRHLRMPPQLVQIEQSYKLNFQSLQFIVDEGDVSVLSDISVAERLFLTTLELIRRRSQVHSEELQPRLEAAGISHNSRYPLASIINAAGQRIDGTLQQMTDDTVTFVDDAEDTLLTTFREFRREMNKIFPNDKFVISVPIPNERASTSD